MATPRKDCRVAFLSKENRYLLDFVANYSNNYVKGCDGERCDLCKRRFKPIVSRWLYCLVSKVRTDRFYLVCLNCWETEGVRDNEYHYFELYPRIRLSDVWQLCRFGVLKKFHFSIDPDKYVVKSVRMQDTQRDILGTFRALVRDKKCNEQIASIALKTFGGLVFQETFDDVVIERNELIRVTPGSSRLNEMLDSNFVFLNKTYVYEVIYWEYANNQPYQIFVDIECNFFCKHCTFDKRYKGNPILFCSNCGNTDSKYNHQFQMDNIEYDQTRLKWYIHKKFKNFFMYYDISDCVDRVISPDYISD